MLNNKMENFNFETGVYRPPSEGGSSSLLVRFTRNCPWNHCTFCSMYKTEKFELRSVEEIKQDIDAIAAMCNALKRMSLELGQGGTITRDAAIALLNKRPELNQHQGFVMLLHWLMAGAKTAFLQDANSLIMKTDALIKVLLYLRSTFPSIERVTSYGRSKTLAQKSDEALVKIRKAGLDRLHLGLETGDDALLKKIKKGVTAMGHIKGGKKALKAGFQISEYWMPGLGGKAMWEDHAMNTARVLNEINPHYIRSRPFRPIEGTPMCQDDKNNQFQMLTPREQLLELKKMVETLEVTSRVCFDHAMNHWRNPSGGLLLTQSYEGYKFPEQKQHLLDLIEEGLSVDQQPPSLSVL